MKNIWFHTRTSFTVWLVLSALMGACAPAHNGVDYGVQSAKGMSTSRVIIPAAGGQTIQVPEKMMADAYGLWHPLNESERKLLGSDSEIPPGIFDFELTAWLPSSEKAVMQRYVYRLTHQRRDLAQKVLERADNYFPIILACIKKYGLPVELACLPMVESAFEPKAVSHAGAAGLWQLMPETARRFGLTVNDTVDDRFDVQKSTAAATAYLTSLYAKFQNWPLALAAYNCGEGAMQRALSNTNAATLSELTQACRAMNSGPSLLAEETLRFVPQFAAAVHIMTNSDKFGLTHRAMLSLEPHSPQTQAKGNSLTLIGRYNSAHKMSAKPARSKRIE